VDGPQILAWRVTGIHGQCWAFIRQLLVVHFTYCNSMSRMLMRLQVKRFVSRVNVCYRIKAVVTFVCHEI
jgi:hypothetical protein